jgi:hypothetical protein
MQFEDYQRGALTTPPPELYAAALALQGSVARILDHARHSLDSETPPATADVADALGSVLKAVAELASLLELDLEQIANLGPDEGTI